MPPSKLKVPLLASYAVIRKWKQEHLDRLLLDDRVELLIDSGAFSAKNSGAEISLDEYMDFLFKNEKRLFGYIALDVIGDPVATEQNLNTMLKAGLKPIPVLTLTEGEERMNYLFTLSEWVALGGFRRPRKGAAPDDYIAMKMKWANGRHVHWLGYTRQPQLLAWKPYSCDSASWAGALMYGRVAVYMGNGRWRNFDKNEFHKKRLVLDLELMKRFSHYEIDTKDLLDERQWRNTNRGVTVVANLPAVSWVEYQQDILKKCGTRVFLALSSSHVLMNPIFYAIDWLERKLA